MQSSDAKQDLPGGQVDGVDADADADELRRGVRDPLLAAAEHDAVGMSWKFDAGQDKRDLTSY